jgi:hypothetical protein
MRRSGEEPEPIDLTHLNIEASMMCLASKVRQADRKSLVLPSQLVWIRIIFDIQVLIDGRLLIP